MRTSGDRSLGGRRRRTSVVLAVLFGITAAQMVGSTSAGADGTTAALSTFNLKALPLPASDIAYDATRGVILASVPGSQASLGNQLVELDPETGDIGRHVFVGSEPGPIALTDDGTTAYVGLRGVNRIARVDLAGFTLTDSFSTGSDSFFGPRFVEDLEAVPGRNDMVAASLMKPGFSPRHEGVWVFDNGVALPQHTAAHTGSNRIEFGSSANLYGYNNETTEFGFRRMTVGSSGVTVVDAAPSAITGFNVDIELAGGRVYSTTGLVIDPETRAALASFGTSGLIEVTPGNNRATFLSGATLRVYNATTTALVDSRTFAGMPTGSTNLIATSTGFAVASANGVTLLGPSVGGPPVTLPAPPSSTMDDLTVVNVAVKATDLAFDETRGRVYASVGDSAPAYANSIVSIDSATGAIDGSLFVGSNPGPLALTDDGSILYVGQSTIGRIASIDLSTFTLGPSFSLGIDPFSGMRSAEDIEVQPGRDTTLAVSLQASGSPRHVGVAIFDDGTARPTLTPGHTGANRIEFGANASSLYGTNNETTSFDFFNMFVSASGVTTTKTTGYLLPGFGTEIQFVDNRVYASSGLVVDPERAELVGRFNASGAFVVDPSNGRTYVAASGGLTEFITDRFTQVAQRSIAFGQLRTMVATSTGFAVATSSQVVLLSRSDGSVAAPRIDSVSPASGPETGDTPVTITGSGFQNATAVSFGSTPAASFSVKSDVEITAQTPAHVPGSVTVSVADATGTGRQSNGFTFTPVAVASHLRLITSGGQWRAAVIARATLTGPDAEPVPGQTLKFYKMQNAASSDVASGQFVGSAVTGATGVASVLYELGPDAPHPGGSVFFAATYEGSAGSYLPTQSATVSRLIVKRNTVTTLSAQRQGSKLYGTALLRRQQLRYTTYSAGVATTTTLGGPMWGSTLTIRWLNRVNSVLGSFETAPTASTGKVNFSKAIPAGATGVRAVYLPTVGFNGSESTRVGF